TASNAQIKKAYYKLSLVYHPDKVKDSDKLDEANTFFASISKAYKTLTTPSLFKNFEDWGDPDGKRSLTLGIAIPRWIVDSHSPYVLFIYGLVLGVILPYSIGRWWYASRKLTKDGIRTETMTFYFRNLTMDMSIKALLKLLCEAEEFQLDVLPKLSSDQWTHLKEALLKTLRPGVTVEVPKCRSPASQDVWYLIMAHVLRVIPNEVGLVQYDHVLTKAFHLLQRGLLQIGFARSWLSTCLNIIELEQCLTQALWDPLSPLLQVPHLMLENIPILKQHQIKSILAFTEMKTKEKTNLLPWSTTQWKDVDCFLNEFPRIVLEKINFRVIGEDNITPGALVTCSIKLRLLPIALPLSQVKEEYNLRKKEKKEKERNQKEPNGSSLLKSNEEVTLSQKDTKEKELVEVEKKEQEQEQGGKKDDDQDDDEEEPDALGLAGEGDGASHRLKFVKKTKQVHAPFFPGARYPGWWLVIGNLATNRVIVAKKVHLEELIQIQFEAPNSVGVFPFSVFLKSEHWVSADMRLDIQMNVEEMKKKPALLNDDDDDISDPEEDSLAGQMAMLRGQRTKRVKGKTSQRRLKNDPREGDDDDDDSSSDDD
ncbi:secretory subunit, partial [Coelomomyces lativittatus]